MDYRIINVPVDVFDRLQIKRSGECAVMNLVNKPYNKGDLVKIFCLGDDSDSDNVLYGRIDDIYRKNTQLYLAVKLFGPYDCYD